jgi:phosphatidylserine/phosphatidylglycerophosphate/cardiolipin synthase-like enzyme
VDLKIAFVGGINIVDDRDHSGATSLRYDYAVRVEGPLVAKIHDAARRVWSRVALTRLRPGWILDSRRHAVSTEARGTMPAAFLLRDNIEKSIETGARRIDENSRIARTATQRLASWLSYGLVRFLIGMAGYAPGRPTGRA